MPAKVFKKSGQRFIEKMITVKLLLLKMALQVIESKVVLGLLHIINTHICFSIFGFDTM